MSDSVGQYLNEIGAVALLTADDEKMLSKAKSSGYPSAFITAFDDGKKINLNEAINKLNK